MAVDNKEEVGTSWEGLQGLSSISQASVTLMCF